MHTDYASLFVHNNVKFNSPKIPQEHDVGTLAIVIHIASGELPK